MIPNTEAKRFVTDIERLQTEMRSKQAEHMAWNKKQRELINGYYDRAKDSGIPKKELKTVVAIRELERKAKKKRDDLEPEQQDTVDMIRSAIGDLADLPLGQAAVDRAEKRNADGAALDDLTEGGDEDDEEDGEDVRPRFLRGDAEATEH
ncbi:hypothetical protein [Chelatococcus reniformis]|uniref:Uncharacterized protein n=1 Tax=Chelatococcus reniformis TaxID=1494448 RepID=A0A916UWG9_9HYPH|nr:hypothetical protein [Chelatococcus reniformis]GGC90604.1 hypothetical protein GCM10010994_55510 [Chelatococcus reniformis]